MTLINCKIHLELNWTEDCVLSSVDNDNNTNPTSFKITETKLYVPIVTLPTKDNANLTKQLNEGFKRSAYWNEYKSKIETKDADNNILFKGLIHYLSWLLIISIMMPMK